jgi:nitric oxide reductase subunit B
VEKGYWYARSPEFMHTDVMQTLRWLRVPGDTIFALGALALVWFVAGLKTGHSLRQGDVQGSLVNEPEPVLLGKKAGV